MIPTVNESQVQDAKLRLHSGQFHGCDILEKTKLRDGGDWWFLGII